MTIDFFTHKVSRIRNSPLARDSFWALMGSVLGKGLSLFAGILIARFLGKDVYGQYGILKNTLLNIAVFSTLGLGYTGTRFIAKSQTESPGDVCFIINEIYRITLISSLVIALSVIAFAPQISIFIKAPDMAGALRLTALIIILNAINTSQIGILSGFKSFKVIAINNVLSVVFTFLSSVIFTFFWALNGALWALLISTFFNVILNYISVKKDAIAYRKQSTTSISRKEIISFSIPIALQESLYTIVHFFSSYLLIFYGGYGELGITSAASQWSAVLLFIPSVMQNVILSYFSSAKSSLALRKNLILINGASTFVPWIIITVLSGIISSFYGPSYSKLNIVLIILCSNSIFSSISNVIVYEFVAKGKNWTMFAIRFIRDFLSLLLAWALLSSRIIPFQASIISASVYSTCGLLFMTILLIVSQKGDHTFVNQTKHEDIVIHKSTNSSTSSDF